MRKIKFIALIVSAVCYCTNILAQDVQNVKPVKNVIVMIPDGCSIATVSTARWYQWMLNPNMPKLAIDPYLCGTVRTTCSDAPIGDSAPTTSCYMTGYPSLAGWVSTYPIAKGKNDIYPMDSARAYQPLTTVMEAARMLKGKATGLVSTCYFPHATPADCSSHSYDRGKLKELACQQAHNGLNVVIGGGTSYMSDDMKAYLESHGVSVFKDDINGMKSCQNKNMWAQFTSGSMSYDLDRNPSKEPSLAEMTTEAIKRLAQHDNGFVLMVEGSEVDYGAHSNDIMAMIGDFLAFDRACKVALDFAEKNGETAVVILPDHGNSGLSIGRRDWGGYATTPKSKMFGALLNIKTTGAGMARKLNSQPYSKAQDLFREFCGFELTERELNALKNCKGYEQSPIKKEDKKADGRNYNNPDNLERLVSQFMAIRTGLAFTTNGHTGEDVFLAAYHPDSECRPYGMLTNIEFNHYLCSLNGFTHDDLDSLTNTNFAPHTEVFDNIKGVKLTADEKSLTVKYKKNTLVFTPNTNIVTVNGKAEEMASVVVYVDKINRYYIPRIFRERLTALK